MLAGLGREVQSTGLLAQDAIDRALAALRRFRALCDALQADHVYVLATAACRDAANGKDFIAAAERICRAKIEVLSGRREAQLSALGILSGIHNPDGIVGDLGGGSLELVDVRGEVLQRSVTLPLGGLALQDRAGRSLKKADKIVARSLARLPALKKGRGRVFYAVGGTWRALARLHMWQTGYPLHVTHGYAVAADEFSEFCRLVYRVNTDMLSRIEVVSDARRPLLGYGALVLDHVIRVAKPSRIVVSVLGVREGLLYSLLKLRQRRQDPLLSASAELNVLRSRSPQHGKELMAWSDHFMASSGIDETEEEKRLRHAACLLADIGWRAHPDYRGEQSLNIIAHAAFVGVDHPGRAFIALAVYFRHVGLVDDDVSPRLRELVSTRLIDHARILGATMRVAYLVSASMPGILPQTPLRVERGKLVLRLPGPFADLGSERLFTRLRSLAKLIGREPVLLSG